MATQLSLPTPPEEGTKDPRNDSPSPPARRSLDYVAERPDGGITPVFGEEFGMFVGYDEVDLQRIRERIALRFSSKSVPQISILEYLHRYVSYLIYMRACVYILTSVV